MKTLKHLSVVITLLLCCHLNMLFGQDAEYKADSLKKALTHADKNQMDEMFAGIRKNRVILNDNYIPLLHLYAHKSKTIDYSKGQMSAYDRIGLQYRYDEVYDSALFYHQLALEIAEDISDSVQMYYCYNNVGQVYRKQNLNVQALQYFHKALKINETSDDTKALSHTQNVIGATYVAQKDYKRAMHYFKLSTELADLNDDIKTLAYNYGSMGEVFLLQNKIDSAIYYLGKSRILKIQMGNNKGIPVINHLIGQAYLMKKDLLNSEIYFKKALDGHIKENTKRYQSRCYAYLGKIYTLQNKFDLSEEYLLQGKLKAEQANSLENLILVYDAFFELYQKTERWEDAITALQKSKIYNDSIININNEEQIRSLEVKYQTEKKEQQIELLSAENEIKNQEIRLSIALILVLLLMTVAIFFIMIIRKRNAQMAQDDLKQKLFRSQMNPHFIYNALGSIQSYMYKNETTKAAQFLGNFASLSRSILKYSAEDTIDLTSEIEMLKNYIELEKMRMPDVFDYEIILDYDLETEFIQIAPMMIQPFVENAIKHGFRDKYEGGKLKLEFIDKKDFLEVIIIDNGVGINNSGKQNSKHESMSTKIFYDRLKYLKKKNKHIPDIEIKDISTKESSGTKVLLYLPILN